jgi:hypothetical protein
MSKAGTTDKAPGEGGLGGVSTLVNQWFGNQGFGALKT